MVGGDRRPFLIVLGVDTFLVGATAGPSPTDTSDFEALLGKTLESERAFLTTLHSGGVWDGTSWMDDPKVADDMANGRRCTLSFKLPLAEVAAGDHNAILDAAFADAESAGFDGFVVLHHEPTDTEDPTEYQDAYIVLKARRDANGPSVNLKQILTAFDYTQPDIDDWHVPGLDRYGVDGYSQPGDPRDADEIFGAADAYLAGLDVDVDEYGIDIGESDRGVKFTATVAWLTDPSRAANWKGIKYFDLNPTPNWLADGDPQLLTAIADAIGVID